MTTKIVQVIGIAHTYQPSLAVRRHLTKDTVGYHSAQSGSLSYFCKGPLDNIVNNGDSLVLRKDPSTGQLAEHWPEPELAMILGPAHEISGYTLANDLTAISIERQGRTPELDRTFTAKVWPGSGSLGPHFVAASEFGNPGDARIRINIERHSQTIFDATYSVDRIRYRVTDLPGLICEMYQNIYRGSNFPSKMIEIDSDGRLPAGTVIMLGTGLVVPARCYCKPSDVVTVSSTKIGSLVNSLRAE